MLGFLLLIAFLTSWGLVFVTTPSLVRIARRVKILDIPSDRKVHEAPIPRIGGLALFLAFFIPFVIFYLSIFLFLELPFTYILNRPDWLGVFTGAVLIFSTGFLDDIRGVSPRLKLMVQCISTLAVVAGGLSIEKVLIPPWGVIDLHPVVSILITIIWCLLVINGFNFIDGLDGLAAGIALICSLFLLIVAFMTNHYYMTLPTVMIAGATIGFLHYNFNPAKVFMGDSGSYFLGYALATSALRISRDDTNNITLIVPTAIILAIPMFDVIVATFRRILRREPIFRPDCYHIHHCILNKGFSHRQSVFILYAANFVMGVLALSYFYLSPVYFWLFFFFTVSSFILIASMFGYFDWFFKSSTVLSIREKLKVAQFQMCIMKDLWMLENSSSLEDMRKRLVSVLARLNLDHARLTIFSPPIADRNIPKEILYSPRLQSRSVLPSAPLQLNIPLIRGKNVHGYLFVEKNVLETSFSQKSFIALLERTTKSLLNYVLKNYPYTLHHNYRHNNSEISSMVRKNTYILIAKNSSLERFH